MKAINFNVTYEITAPEGENTCGTISRGERLREAIGDVTGTRTSRCGGVECVETDEWPIRAPRWIRVANGPEYETGAQESRWLHIPDRVTPASRIRICKLLGAL